MRPPISRRTVGLYLVILATAAVPALLILALVGFALVMVSGHSRDDALLGLIISAPVWLAGLLAAVVMVTVLRGRRPRLTEVTAVSLAALAGGAALFVAQGSLDLLVALVGRPQDVDLGWPIVTLWYADRTGAVYHRLDAAGLWLSLMWLVLGGAGVATAWSDWRRPPSGDPTRIGATALVLTLMTSLLGCTVAPISSPTSPATPLPTPTPNGPSGTVEEGQCEEAG